MNRWYVIGVCAWFAALIVFSAWLLSVLGWDPNNSRFMLGFSGLILLALGNLGLVVKLMHELDNEIDTHEKVAREANVKLADASTRRYKIEEDLKSCAQERAELERRCCRFEGRSREALKLLARNISVIRSLSSANATNEMLKSIRTDEIEVAVQLFIGLEKFTWRLEDIQPSVCRDYVAKMIRQGEVDIEDRWIADFIRFAHSKGNDEQTAA